MRKLACLALMAIVMLALDTCYFPGTATLQICNELSRSRTITDLYVYPTGSDKGKSIISKPLAYDENTTKWFVDPGDTTIEAVIDGGPATVIKQMTLESAYYPLVYITD